MPVPAGIDKDAGDSMEADDPPSSQALTDKTSRGNPANYESTPAGHITINARPMAAQTIVAVIVGPIGFILLLVCTAMIVLRLRVGPFVPSANIALIVMLSVDLFLGIISVTLGHLAIIRFHRIPGSTTERNLIVIGLSCGYTILILSLLFAVVLLISALA